MDGNRSRVAPERAICVGIALGVITACAQPTGASAPANDARGNKEARTTAIPPSATISASTPEGRGASAQPDQCTSGGVRALVARFIEAFNTGDEHMLDEVWARDSAGWGLFATDGPEPRVQSAAEDRAGLPAYFARRHASRERWRLITFQFNGTADRGDFEYTLVRTADDLPATNYIGKGFANCTSQPHQLAMWSMARYPRTR